MVAKIVRFSILMLFISVTNVYSQKADAQEKERERFVRKQFEEYNQRVDLYTSLLDLDDFKRQILKQKVDDFYQQRQRIMMSELPEYEKEAMVDQLKFTHFEDVEELYSESTIASVQRFLSDNKAEIKRIEKAKKTKKNK